MVPEDTMQAIKGGRQPAVLPSYATYDPHRQPAWRDNPKGVVVAHTLRVTSSFLTGLKTCSTRGQLCLGMKTYKPFGASEVIDIGGEPTAPTIPNSNLNICP